MATIAKLLYSTWQGNILGGSLLSLWLAIDFNSIKLAVLGIMSMVWAIGYGLIFLWRAYIKGEKERIELEIMKKNNGYGKKEIKPQDQIQISKPKNK